MNTYLVRITFVLSAILLPSAARGTIIFFADNFQNYAYDNVTDDTHVFENVTSPFAASHTASVPPLASHADFAAVFDDQSGQFSFNALHASVDLGHESIVSTCTVLGFSTDADVAVQVHGSYSYHLEGILSQADISSSALQYFFPGGDAVTISAQDHYAVPPNPEYPPIDGTLSLDDAFVFPAGGTYSIVACVQLSTDGGNIGTQHAISGDGNMQITYASVPEPAAMILLLPGLLTIARRRR